MKLFNKSPGFFRHAVMFVTIVTALPRHAVTFVTAFTQRYFFAALAFNIPTYPLISAYQIFPSLSAASV